MSNPPTSPLDANMGNNPTAQHPTPNFPTSWAAAELIQLGKLAEESWREDPQDLKGKEKKSTDSPQSGIAPMPMARNTAEVQGGWSMEDATRPKQKFINKRSASPSDKYMKNKDNYTLLESKK